MEPEERKSRGQGSLQSRVAFFQGILQGSSTPSTPEPPSPTTPSHKSTLSPRSSYGKIECIKNETMENLRSDFDFLPALTGFSKIDLIKSNMFVFLGSTRFLSVQCGLTKKLEMSNYTRIEFYNILAFS